MIRWQEDITDADVELVGSKAAALAFVRSAFGPGSAGAGDDPILTPDGFVITSDVGESVLADAAVVERLCTLRDALAAGAGASEVVGLTVVLRDAIRSAPSPDGLDRAVRAALQQLRGHDDDPPLLAVRSSAVAEDIAGASYAGQYDSLLGLQLPEQVLDAYWRVLASLFGDRTVWYRRAAADAGRVEDVRMAVAVQRLVRADQADGVAGVMFTGQPDPDGIDPGPVQLIEAVRGLSTELVGGRADPDRYVRNRSGVVRSQTAAPPGSGASSPALTTEQVDRLAGWGDRLHDLFGGPVDVEWAQDGVSGQLVVVQVRPLADSIRSTFDNTADPDEESPQRPVLVRGLGIGTGSTTGTARVVHDPLLDHEFADGDVLVAGTTDPAWLPLMQRAAAIVTDHGGRTSHAAIVCRELGLLAVVGCGDATQRVADGAAVRITCESNGVGLVYGA